MKDKALPKLIHGTDHVMIQMARTLLAITERRDTDLKDHCLRVADNCANFCETLNFAGEEEVEAMFIVGLVHDIGLVFLPLSVLQKPEELTEEESDLVKNHPVVGESILGKLTTIMKPLTEAGIRMASAVRKFILEPEYFAWLTAMMPCGFHALNQPD
jgi:HD-GYP domain-containing protein (c-di-GMP phosphodiesterase class II)